MSCNTFIPIMDLVREVEALLAANYIDKDDPRITGGVFTNPTIKEGFLLDVQAREEFCRLVQECGLDAPFGKMWLSRPLYPDSMFVSYEDSGEPQTKWKTIQAVLESAGVFGPAATSLSSRLAAEITRATDADSRLTERANTADTNIATNAAAITTENRRATAAEGVLTTDVAAMKLTDASLQSQVNSIGGGKRAYTTYAKMEEAAALPVGDPLKLPANSSVDVTNDADPSKNGTYAYDGTTFTKSPYDPLTLAKADATTKANTAKSEAITESVAQSTSNTKTIVAEATKYITQTGSAALHQWTDENDLVVGSINSNAEFEAQDFKTEKGSLSTVVGAINQIDISDYTHVFNDINGNILMGIKQDGSIVGGSSGGSGLAEMRAGLLNSIEMNEVGPKLDAKYFEDAPLTIDAVIALNTGDGAVGSRMPLIIKTGKNELCCIYHRMGLTTTDQLNVELVQRFITYDLVAKTVSISAMTSIIGDAMNSPLVYHGQNCTKLKNGDFLLTYAHNKVHYKKISTDNCRTWSEPIAFITLAGNSSTIINGVADGLVRIKDGEYNGRLVLALWGTTPDGNIGGEVGCYYSDDEGVTWTLGGSIFDADFNDTNLISINEVAVACDAQNNLIFTIRNEGYSKSKSFDKVVFAISKDGGLTLEPYGAPRFSMSAVQPAFLQMSPTTYDGVPKMLMAHATAGGFNRSKFKLRLSYDNFNSIYAEHSPFAENINVGYSSLEKLDNSTVALAYEDGLTSERNIKIKLINLAEII